MSALFYAYIVTHFRLEIISFYPHALPLVSAPIKIDALKKLKKVKKSFEKVLTY